MPFEIVRNDITKMKVDAIVNAANHTLLGVGGVDGAIHKAAGPELLEACRALGGCRTGEAKITKGYRLPARYVIHTVGPVWRGGKSGEREQLLACYRNSLALALEYHCESVAFPLISTGAYGYPKEEAMAAAIEAVSAFLLENDMTVYLVVFGRSVFDISRKLFRDVQEYIDDVYAEEHYSSQAMRSRRAISFEEEGESIPAEDENLYAAEIRYDAAPMAPKAAAEPDWQAMVRQTDEGFSQTLLRLIDEKGLTDAQCYKRANVDRKHFSKIRSNPAYQPSKATVFAFAVSLELTLGETKELLRKAGFALTHASKLDIILEYFIRNRNYNIYEINEVLFQFDQPLLGAGAK